MKNPNVGKMNKYNQQWKHPKAIVTKIIGEMKTLEEAVMKTLKGFS